MLRRSFATAVISASLALLAACSGSPNVDQQVRAAVADYVDAINDGDLERLQELTNCSLEPEPLPVLLRIADAHRQLGSLRFDISRVASEPGEYVGSGFGFTITPDREGSVAWVEGVTWVASDRIRSLAPEFPIPDEGWIWVRDDQGDWSASECS